MQTTNTNELSIPENSEVPVEIRQAVREQVTLSKQAELARLSEQMTKIQEIRQKQAMARNILKETGIDRHLFGALRQQQWKRLVTQASLLTRGGEPVVVALPEEVSEAIRTGTKSAVHAPYPVAINLLSYDARDGFSLDETLFTDPTTGTVGGKIVLIDSDAGDSDYAIHACGSAIRFWYQVPATGVIDAVIDTQCVESRIYVHLRDEFGFSGADVYNMSTLVMRVDGEKTDGSWLSAKLYEFDKIHQETDGIWDEGLQPGITLTQGLKDNKVFLPGTWVLLTVGVWNRVAAQANDVATEIRSTQEWLLKTIWLFP